MCVCMLSLGPGYCPGVPLAPPQEKSLELLFVSVLAVVRMELTFEQSAAWAVSKTTEDAAEPM